MNELSDLNNRNSISHKHLNELQLLFFIKYFRTHSFIWLIDTQRPFIEKMALKNETNNFHILYSKYIIFNKIKIELVTLIYAFNYVM